MENKMALIAIGIALVLIMNISNVSAADTNNLRFVGKTGTQISVTETCSDEGYPCTSAYYCNITIIDPFQKTIVNNELMTNQFSFHNISLSDDNTSLSGLYEANTYCSNGERNGTNQFYYKLTPNGELLDTGKGTMFILFILGIGAIFGLCLYFAIRIPFKNQRDEENTVISVNDLKYVKIFLMVICYVILVLFFGLSRSIFANYIYESGIDTFFTWGFWIMFSMMWPLIVCSLIFSFILFLEDNKIKDAIERGLPFE